MNEPEFQETILKSVKSLQEQTAVLMENHKQLEQKTQAALEDIGTKAKDSTASLEDRVAAVQRAQVQLVREQRMAFADPRSRVSESPEKKAAIAASVFRAAGRPVPESITKALGEDSSPGSTMIDDELATDIYDLLLRFGAWSSLGVRRMGTKNTKMPVKTARPTANFILTEGAASTGPRLFRRGDSRLATWRELSRSCFNGAAPFQARRSQ